MPAAGWRPTSEELRRSCCSRKWVGSRASSSSSPGSATCSWWCLAVSCSSRRLSQLVLAALWDRSRGGSVSTQVACFTPAPHRCLQTILTIFTSKRRLHSQSYAERGETEHRHVSFWTIWAMPPSVGRTVSSATAPRENVYISHVIIGRKY